MPRCPSNSSEEKKMMKSSTQLKKSTEPVKKYNSANSTNSTTTTSTSNSAPAKVVKKVRVKKKIVKEEKKIETPPVTEAETNVEEAIENEDLDNDNENEDLNNDNDNDNEDLNNDNDNENVLENEEGTETTNEKKKKPKMKKEDFIPKWEYLFEAYATELKAARKQPNQTQSLLKYVTQLKNDTYKFLKLRKRKQDGDKSSGFMKPVGISDELEDFIGEKPNNAPITRVFITQRLCNYIKQMQLQNPEDKRLIIPDEKLKKLFDIEKDGEKLTYYSMQQLVQKHIYKLP